VFSGTCFEYAFKSAPLKESDPLNPATIYARCKNELRYQAEVFAQASNLSFGWGRIFYVLGHNEAPNRLLPYIVASLQNGQKAVIKGGSLIRDYMYTKDIAGAFVQFLMSDIKGCVNICSGEGIAIWDLSFKLAEKLGRPDLLEFTDNAQDQPPVIIGDNMRLCTEIGYSLKYDLESALGYICHSTIG
jgi:nucleoside-diphosphate-sugar epimerase